MQAKALPAEVNPRPCDARSSTWPQKSLHCKRLTMLHSVSRRELLYRVRASAKLKGASLANLSWNGSCEATESLSSQWVLKLGD